MEQKKETNLRCRRRFRGVRQNSSGTKSKGLDLPVVSSDVELPSIELKVDAAGVSGLDDDFPPASDRALTARGQGFGRGRFAVGGDRDPRLLAGLDDDRKLVRSCGGGGHRQFPRRQTLRCFEGD